MYEPGRAAFHAATAPSLCLDYLSREQAFGVWACEEAAAAHGEATFEFRRMAGKYPLRRGHGSTCVMEASGGRQILLRVPGDAECIGFGGARAPADFVPCDITDVRQQWVRRRSHFSPRHTYHPLTRPPTPLVFQTGDGSFRPAAGATACLELRTRGEESL